MCALFLAFCENGSLSYPYKIRNSKMCQDLGTSFHIYVHHPFTCVFFTVAAGLITCLKAMDFLHSNLVYPTNLQLHNKFDSEKEMYDWLPKSDILKAVKWILMYIGKKSRRSSM